MLLLYANNIFICSKFHFKLHCTQRWPEIIIMLCGSSTLPTAFFSILLSILCCPHVVTNLLQNSRHNWIINLYIYICICVRIYNRERICSRKTVLIISEFLSLYVKCCFFVKKTHSRYIRYICIQLLCSSLCTCVLFVRQKSINKYSSFHINGRWTLAQCCLSGGPASLTVANTELALG